jgi:HEAT repeat protein
LRFAAAEALGQLCDGSAYSALEKRLKDEDEGVRAKARWALSRLKKAGVRATASSA